MVLKLKPTKITGLIVIFGSLIFNNFNFLFNRKKFFL